jgi:hypothetical protein
VVGVSPSFTKYEVRDWVNKEPKRKILFSVMKVPTKGHGSGAWDGGRYGIKAKLAICKYDVYITLLECRTHKEYRCTCDKKRYPDTQMIRRGGYIATCLQSAKDEIRWGKDYQCKPNKASCEGGAIAKRDIGVKLDPTHPGSKRKECQRFLLPLDAMVRWGIGPIASLNTEQFQQSACAGTNVGN